MTSEIGFPSRREARRRAAEGAGGTPLTQSAASDPASEASGSAAAQQERPASFAPASRRPSSEAAQGAANGEGPEALLTEPRAAAPDAATSHPEAQHPDPVPAGIVLPTPRSTDQAPARVSALGQRDGRSAAVAASQESAPAYPTSAHPHPMRPGSAHPGSTHDGSSNVGSTSLGSTHSGPTHQGSTHQGPMSDANVMASSASLATGPAVATATLNADSAPYPVIPPSFAPTATGEPTPEIPTWDALLSGESEPQASAGTSFPTPPLGGWNAQAHTAPTMTTQTTTAQTDPDHPVEAPELAATPSAAASTNLAEAPEVSATFGDVTAATTPQNTTPTTPAQLGDDSMLGTGVWGGARLNDSADSGTGGGSGGGDDTGFADIEPARPPRRRRTVGGVIWSIVGVIAELLVTVGLLLLMFVAWQLWWTDIVGDREQAQEISSLQQSPGWINVAPEAPEADLPVGTKHTEDPPLVADQVQGDVFATMYVPRWGEDWMKPIAEGTDRAKVLDSKGIGRYTDTAMPGQVGNFALAGHRQTHGKPFYSIDKLEDGDKFIIETTDAYYVYRYTQHEIVDPVTGGWVIGPDPLKLGNDPRMITLTTCHPINSTAQRWIAWGEFEYWTPKSEGIAPDLPQATARLAAQSAAQGGN